jgi:hypothetical protein
MQPPAANAANPFISYADHHSLHGCMQEHSRVRKIELQASSGGRNKKGGKLGREEQVACMHASGTLEARRHSYSATGMQNVHASS